MVANITNIQLLHQMQEQVGMWMAPNLTHFTNDMNNYEDVSNLEALFALKEE